MKAYTRILWTLGFLMTTLAGNEAYAQSGVFKDVRVALSVPGLTFTVDNVSYDSSQIFRWQVGDVHTIRIPKSPTVTQNPPLGGGNASAIGSRVTYGGVYTLTTENSLPVPAGVFQDLTTVADSEYIYRIQMWSFLQSIEFSTARAFQLRFRTPAVGCAPTAGDPMVGACGDNPGYVEVQCSDGAVFNVTNTDIWCPAGQTQFTAIPAVGYAFSSWDSNPGLTALNTNGTAGSLTFNITSPLHMQVNFAPGKLYRIKTEPLGLDVIIDNNKVKTSNLPDTNTEICTRYNQAVASGNVINLGQGGETSSNSYCVVWAVGSTRRLSATEIQLTKTGDPLVFDSWSFGGGQNSEFRVAGANLSTDELIARFLPAGRVTFVSQPQTSLPLIVNNRTWPSYNFWFGVGKDIPFAAPLETVDASGRRWRFKGWSNGGPAVQTLRITQEIVEKGLYLVAYYEPLNRLSIETNPPGLSVMVDGSPCATPCTVERLSTESVSVAPMPSVTENDVLRLEFTNWSDGASRERSVGFEAESRRLVANYKQLYRLTALADPREGATFTFNPAAPDSFYDLGAQVSVTARPSNGFRFRRWDGDTAGQFPTASVTIGGPRTIVALMEKIPYLDPAGIRNSAGTGPQDRGDIGRVAPGSLVTIYGVNLTPKQEVGPASPMAQTLAEVAVRIGDRLLPLSFASGYQINAQVPYDIPVGRHKITVFRTGQQDVSGDVEIVRNGPGIFTVEGTESPDTAPLAVAIRPDNSKVSDTNPAQPNEVIQLLGTGLGPYRNNPPAGFAIPAGAEFALLDPVEIIVNDQVVQPTKVIAYPTLVGVTSIQFRVGPQFSSGQASSLRIRVNGKDSNTVRLLVR